MKKGIAVITAFIIGISYFSSEMAVMAAWDEKPLEESKSSSENICEESKEEQLDNNLRENSEIQTDNPESEMKNLQMPQKWKVVIDPWELDGKGQVYSEQYVIRNVGKNTGILTLSNLSCKPHEKSNVIIRKNKNGIHDGETKSLYMEIVFGTGERIILSEEGNEYKVELEPGEELSVNFVGEVNEHASEGWENAEIVIGVVYSWNMEKEAIESEKESDAEDRGDRDKEETGDVFAEKSDIATAEEERMSVLELNLPQEAEITADSWNMDENGEIVSAKFNLWNVGQTTGVLTLSELICRSKEKKYVEGPDDMEGSDNEMMDGGQPDNGTDNVGENTAYIEVLSENGERILSSLGEQEISEYKIELKPGENLIFYFLNGLDFMGENNFDEFDMTIKYSWTIEEKLPEQQ